MLLYVPEIGDHLLLTRDWQFKLYPERRNKSISTELKLTEFKHWEPENRKYFNGWYDDELYPQPIYNWQDGSEYQEWAKTVKKVLISDLYINFPYGTILKIDRVYIRKGAKDFSSITFHAKNIECVDGEFILSKKKKPKSYRFWAKLSDCNNIDFELQNL